MRRFLKWHRTRRQVPLANHRSKDTGIPDCGKSKPRPGATNTVAGFRIARRWKQGGAGLPSPSLSPYCRASDLLSARFATLEPQKLFRRTYWQKLRAEQLRVG